MASRLASAVGDWLQPVTRRLTPGGSPLFCESCPMFRTLPLLLIAAPLVAAPSASVVDGKIVVTGLLSTKAMSVVVADGTEDEVAARPAVGGDWSSADGQVVFTPKYPLKPGARYRVT